MNEIKQITEAAVKGKRVLVRVDYNVPTRDGKVTDNERLLASIDTINYLQKKGAVIVLCSHFGRPKKTEPELSLSVVVPELEKITGQKINFEKNCIGTSKEKTIECAAPGDIILLENVRYHPGEESDDERFAEDLARGCDLFVNDAFSASHRAHASIVGITRILPAYAGFSLMAEIDNLSPVLAEPKKPYVMISGGAKISDKIETLKKMLDKVDVLVIGGGMANTFLASEGYEVGKSLYEEDFIEKAEEISRLAEEKGVELILPDDVVVAKAVTENARGAEKSLDEIEKSEIIVDVGTRSIAKFAEPLKFAGTIFWNGPIGINENKNFAKGTISLAKIVSESMAFSVVGGGDTVSAVSELELQFGFVSTGGGATLEFLAGENLPGIEALK